MHLTVLPDSADYWNRHLKGWRMCTRCDMSMCSHNHVFARGTLPCNILFVGEGPGKTEDATGFPFVGRAGKLLDEWIVMGIPAPLTYAITNVVSCRPADRPGGPNREPTPDEILNCRPRLMECIDIAMPDMIVMLGRVAADSCPPISHLPRLDLKHPAYILRQGGIASKGFDTELDKLKEFIRKVVASAH